MFQHPKSSYIKEQVTDPKHNLYPDIFFQRILTILLKNFLNASREKLRRDQRLQFVMMIEIGFFLFLRTFSCNDVKITGKTPYFTCFCEQKTIDNFLEVDHQNAVMILNFIKCKFSFLKTHKEYSDRKTPDDNHENYCISLYNGVFHFFDCVFHVTNNNKMLLFMNCQYVFLKECSFDVLTNNFSELICAYISSNKAFSSIPSNDKNRLKYGRSVGFDMVNSIITSSFINLKLPDTSKFYFFSITSISFIRNCSFINLKKNSRFLSYFKSSGTLVFSECNFINLYCHGSLFSLGSLSNVVFIDCCFHLIYDKLSKFLSISDKYSEEMKALNFNPFVFEGHNVINIPESFFGIDVDRQFIDFDRSSNMSCKAIYFHDKEDINDMNNTNNNNNKDNYNKEKQLENSNLTIDKNLYQTNNKIFLWDSFSSKEKYIQGIIIILLFFFCFFLLVTVIIYLYFCKNQVYTNLDNHIESDFETYHLTQLYIDKHKNKRKKTSESWNSIPLNVDENFNTSFSMNQELQEIPLDQTQCENPQNCSSHCDYDYDHDHVFS
ncbi:hypothetical protein TRFO_38531 [Tritrichomonas foetus]|uniref:Uncharacterized protein n=1 Tax=Tritrichomonas foetus TaxID=1144522 RepID=A0A1J4JCH6_9EUKA|nr:hypothetical protein TRFO_38531 [Tritrichomonas foetus]|eukprot:OHS95363.1 hypothetical protein TRFO_38531 [Tritrichomonas foetus]